MKAKVISRNSQVAMPVTTQEDQLREEALHAKDMIDSGYMMLARCLYDIYHQNIFSNHWNYNSFEEYIDNEIQVTYRKAMYLVEIYGKAKLLNMDMTRLEKMGWTKAKELIRVVDESNIDEWMSRAENATAKELNVLVRREKDKQADRSSIVEEAPIITTITFKLGMAEHAIIDDALQESKSLINSNDLALSLTNICQEWLEIKGIVPKHSSLEDHLQNLERLYGRKIVIAGLSETATLYSNEDEEPSNVDDDDDDLNLPKDSDDEDDSLDEFLN